MILYNWLLIIAHGHTSDVVGEEGEENRGLNWMLAFDHLPQGNFALGLVWTQNLYKKMSQNIARHFILMFFWPYSSMAPLIILIIILWHWHKARNLGENEEMRLVYCREPQYVTGTFILLTQEEWKGMLTSAGFETEIKTTPDKYN